MDFRTVYRLEENLWTTIEFDDIKKGDMIKVYESDGELVGEFITDSDAEPCKPEGNMMFKVANYVTKEKG